MVPVFAETDAQLVSEPSPTYLQGVSLDYACLINAGRGGGIEGICLAVDEMLSVHFALRIKQTRKEFQPSEEKVRVHWERIKRSWCSY